MNHKLAMLSCAVGLAFASTAKAQAPVEIQWWHAMSGALGERVKEFADNFNASQAQYKVVPTYKGSYAETMTAGIAASRAGNAPHVLQVFEVGTATMMAAKKSIKPVYQLMADAGEKFDANGYISAVTGYYSDSAGNMISFPFNSSTPVMYYNRDALKKAGINEKALQTWPEVVAAATKLTADGAKCGFTSAWQSWVQLENFSAWHNTTFANNHNGFDGFNTKLMFNSPLHIRHVENIADWMKKGVFTYGGRTNEAEAKFYSGECMMLTTSSAGYANIKRLAKFDFGVAPLPYYKDVAGAPQNTIIGGASLWVMGGRPEAEYKGVAKFFSYLSDPQRQSTWHQVSGYLPITFAAYETTKKSNFYQQNPDTDVSVIQMIEKKATPTSRGLRLGNFPQIRTINDEELENVWSGKKSAKQALDDAVARGNTELEKFARANAQ